MLFSFGKLLIALGFKSRPIVATFFRKTNSEINKLARKQPLANRCSTGDFGCSGTQTTVCVSFIAWCCDGRPGISSATVVWGKEHKEYEENEEHRGVGGSSEVKMNTRECGNPLAPVFLVFLVSGYPLDSACPNL